jgi:hypothetical protein
MMRIIEALPDRPGFHVWPMSTKVDRKATGVEVRKLLREINPDLEQRSLRRGALQAMGENGTSEADLLTFSGHASVEMLRRYLSWGSNSKARLDKARKAAGILIGENEREQSDDEELSGL